MAAWCLRVAAGGRGIHAGAHRGLDVGAGGDRDRLAGLRRDFGVEVAKGGDGKAGRAALTRLAARSPFRQAPLSASPA